MMRAAPAAERSQVAEPEEVAGERREPARGSPAPSARATRWDSSDSRGLARRFRSGALEAKRSPNGGEVWKKRTRGRGVHHLLREWRDLNLSPGFKTQRLHSAPRPRTCCIVVARKRGVDQPKDDLPYSLSGSGSCSSTPWAAYYDRSGSGVGGRGFGSCRA